MMVAAFLLFFATSAALDGSCPSETTSGVEDLGATVAAAAKSGGGMESALRAIVKSGTVPADFRVSYDDVHGMYGGTQFSVGSDTVSLTPASASPGIVSLPATKVIVERGQRRESTAIASNAALLEIAKKLVVIKAWESPSPAAAGGTAVVDSSAAKLTVAVGGQSVVLTEPFNDLAKNNRISQVKKDLDSLFTAAPAP